MIAPGTAAINLPPFVAPAFSAARVPFGGTVTSITLEGSGANVPFTFGQPFKEGDLAPGDGLVGKSGNLTSPLQLDMKATHNDGSVRHAIISGVMPSLPGSALVELVRAPGKAWTVAAAPMRYADVSLAIGETVYHAAPIWLDDVWLSGPIVTECVHNVPLMNGADEHPNLGVQFAIRQYAAGPVKVDVTIEHVDAYTAITDIAYHVEISVGDEPKFAADVTHFPCTRWKKSFWLGAAPDVHVRHDIPYLIASMQVPNYDQRVMVSEATLADYASAITGPTFAPMGRGRFAAVFAQTGGRPELGLAPDSYAATVLTMDKRAKAMMLASADAAGSWPTHRRDTSTGPAAGRPIDIIHWPRATLAGTPMDSLNKLTGGYEKFPALATTCPNQPDCSHQAAFAYFPYLLSGDFYYLEELHFWANYCLYSANPGTYYRDGARGLINRDQVRGQGWTLRTLAQAAAITPDVHPAKQAFRYWLDNNLDWYNENYTDAPSVPGTATTTYNPSLDNRLGLIANGPFGAYAVNGVANSGMAPWMDDFFTSAVGHAAELGFPKAARLLAWKAQFPIGRMTAPGYCQTDAAVYALAVRPSATSPLFSTFKECWDATMPAGTVCNPSAPMTGYPTIPTGYPSNMQPALAMAATSGAPGGPEAWALFDARAVKPDYTAQPQFAIVPRIAAVTPAPVPTPEPAPVPPAPVPPPPPPPPPPPEAPPAKPQLYTSPVVTKGTVIITSAALSSKKGLRVNVYEPTTMRAVLTSTNRTASAAGAVDVTSGLLLGGKQYAAWVTDAKGLLLAGVKP